MYMLYMNGHSVLAECNKLCFVSGTTELQHIKAMELIKENAPRLTDSYALIPLWLLLQISTYCMCGGVY